MVQQSGRAELRAVFGWIGQHELVLDVHQSQHRAEQRRVLPSEERQHAMMMVQYLLDNDLPVGIPGIDEVRNDFTNVRELVELTLKQERAVTDQIAQLARTARDEGDYLGEQFMQWFLKEQVEEVATVSTLLTVVERAGDNLFHIEDFVAREMARPARTDTTAPKAAGGAA